MANTWDSLRALGTWDYIAQLYATWDDLYNDVRQPAPPIPPIPGPQAGVTPDLAGLSLGGAYQAGLAAGFENFQVVAYRRTWMLNPTQGFLEVAPEVGYVAQTTSPGSGGDTSNAPDGSFFTEQPTPGVPDQTPNPGDAVATNGTLSFVFQTADDSPQPNDIVNSGTDPATGVMTWWEYSFTATNVPGTLQAHMGLYNGPPLPSVDVTDAQWPQTAVDPLLIFTNPPLVVPEDLLSDVPPFEHESYEIATVLRVVAGELGRIAAAQGGLTQQWFPSTADVLLGQFEQMLGLPVNPANTSLEVRRAIVLAYLRRLRVEGTGLDWIASMNSLAGTAWSYAEHDPASPDSPDPYTINVSIPEVLATVGWNFVRDITPAHIAINESYTGGWLVGIADIGITPFPEAAD
jgi:Bacteriophage Mu-like, Gp48